MITYICYLFCCLHVAPLLLLIYPCLIWEESGARKTIATAIIINTSRITTSTLRTRDMIFYKLRFVFIHCRPLFNYLKLLVVTFRNKTTIRDIKVFAIWYEVKYLYCL